MFTISQLTSFLTCVKTGSLNKAAKELYISQPALTKQLSHLEDELDCQLFRRKATGVELTEAGYLFADRAASIIELIELTSRDMHRYSRNKLLRIGALPSAASYFLPNQLDGLQRFGHHVSIDVKETSIELIQSIHDGELDVAFIQNQSNDKWDELHFLKLFNEPYFAIVPIKHPFAERTAIAFHELMEEALIVHKAPCAMRIDLRRACREIGVEPQIALELGFNDSIIPFVAKGRGLSFVPQMVAQHLTEPLIKVIPFAGAGFTRSIWAVYADQLDPRIIQRLDDMAHSYR